MHAAALATSVGVSCVPACLQVQLAELEAQRRECLEAITDATTELVRTADAVDGAHGATRVRQLEGTVAQLRSDLRAAGGAARGGAGSARTGADEQVQAQHAQLQAQLRLARQVVLEEQERTSMAQVRLPVLVAVGTSCLSLSLSCCTESVATAACAL